jgi:hypothetical protein
MVSSSTWAKAGVVSASVISSASNFFMNPPVKKVQDDFPLLQQDRYHKPSPHLPKLELVSRKAAKRLHEHAAKLYTIDDDSTSMPHACQLQICKMTS